MKRIAILTAVYFGLLTAAQADDPDARYNDLVAKAERGDTGTDYTALRLAYADSSTYDPYGSRTRPLFGDTWKALQAKDCKTVLEKSDALLKIDFTEIAVHTMRAECLDQSGDNDGSAREIAIARGLADSLFGSGDGKSVKTAYVVISLGEEHMVLARLDAHETEQALLNSDGKPFDRITAKNNTTGETTGVFFDVSALFRGLARTLGKKTAQ